MKRNTVKLCLICLGFVCLSTVLTLVSCVPLDSMDSSPETIETGGEPMIEETTTSAPNADEEPEQERPSDPYDEDGFPNLPEDDETKRY